MEHTVRTDRQTDIFLQILTLRGTKYLEKSFSLIGKKKYTSTQQQRMSMAEPPDI